MDDSSAHVPMDSIEHTIYLIRSQEVMLDADLAELYGVQTKVLKNERAVAVKFKWHPVMKNIFEQ